MTGFGMDEGGSGNDASISDARGGNDGSSGGPTDSGGGSDARGDAPGTGTDGTVLNDTGPTNDGSAADMACTDLVASLCSKTQSCAPFAITYGFGDMAACTARGKLGCPAIFGATGTGVTLSGAETCAQATMTATCDDLFGNKPPSACVFHGSIALGAACGEDGQCPANAFCNIPLGQACGVCAPLLAAGGTCRGDGNCQTGLVCFKQGNSPTGSCVTPGMQGAPCNSTQPCLATLGCGPSGTCGPALGAGASCGSVQNCDYLQGLYCNTLTGTCMKVQEAAGGSPCGVLLSASYAVCTASGRCALAAGSTTMGTCQATAAEGQPCDATNGPPCLPPAICAGGVCTFPSATCH